MVFGIAVGHKVDIAVTVDVARVDSGADPHVFLHDVTGLARPGRIKPLENDKVAVVVPVTGRGAHLGCDDLDVSVAVQVPGPQHSPVGVFKPFGRHHVQIPVQVPQRQPHVRVADRRQDLGCPSEAPAGIGGRLCRVILIVLQFRGVYGKKCRGVSLRGKEATVSRRWGDVWLPLMLIGLGALFLVSNVLDLDLYKLWPLLLVLIGLAILAGWRVSPGKTGEIRQPLEGATAAEVSISPGVSRLSIAALAEPTLLIQGSVTAGRGRTVEPHFQLQGDTARFRLKSRVQFPFPGLIGWREYHTWDLGLNPGVPTHLTIKAGVGESFLDLSDLKLTHLKIDAGVGRTDVTLPRQGQIDARIEAGVGEVSVRIPRDMAARIRVSSGLGSTRVRGDFQRRAKTYVSPGYDTAENRLELRINGGVGAISVRQVEG